MHIDLDEISSEITQRDCKGSIEIANEKLKTVTTQIEAARIKKNFKRVIHSLFLFRTIVFPLVKFFVETQPVS